MKRVNIKQRVLDALSTGNSVGKNSGGSSTSTSGGTNSVGGKNDLDVPESLTLDCFQLCKIVRHGFPHRPTALAYDPVQKLIAIGNRAGCIRILGQPGVDVHMSHDLETPVIQLLFLVNEGGLISVCADDSIHMWNLRQKKPGILHSLKFNKERITFCHLPYMSKWLYVGTDRGNLHLCCIETFVLSGYTINWNKAIELSQKSHPGVIVGISENPCDENKLLIAFETGLILLWDLKVKTAEHRYYSDSPVRQVTWHHEGKQFMCCHSNGSLSVWNYRNPQKPQQVQFPHAKSNDSSKFDSFRPIEKLEWKTCRNSEPFVIFTGGLSTERANSRPSVTVMHGKSVTVLEMDYNVVDFIAISQTPWQCDFQDPIVLAILLEQELVVVDLTTPGYPCIEFPHPIDIHDSPVTCLNYVLDSNSDLTPGLYQVAATKPKRSTASKTEWPMDGGEWSVDSCTGFPEIMVTGHADGTIRFWDASAVSLKALYKLRTYKFFKKPNGGHNSQREDNSEHTMNQETHIQEDDPLAISHMHVCPESRTMVVSNVSSTVISCELSKKEATHEFNCIEIHPTNESQHFADSPSTDNAPSPAAVNELKPLLRQESDSLFASGTSGHKILSKSFSDDVRGTTLSQQTINQLPASSSYLPLLRLKAGNVKQTCGFQAYLFCQFTGSESEPPPQITELSYNSSYGLIVIGNVTSLCIIDSIKDTVLLNMTTADILYSIDHKKPRSPNKMKPPVSLGDIVQLCTAASDQNAMKSPSAVEEDITSGGFSVHKRMSSTEESHPTSPLTPRRLSKFKFGNVGHFFQASRRISLGNPTGSNLKARKNSSAPCIVLTPSVEGVPTPSDLSPTKEVSSMYEGIEEKGESGNESGKDGENNKDVHDPEEKVSKSPAVSPQQRKSIGSMFRKSRYSAPQLSMPVDFGDKFSPLNEEISDEQEFANGNHVGHSGSRTPYKESTSSIGSIGMVPPPRPKKLPHRGLNKKTGSLSFEKSLDSQASIVTDDSAFSRASSISDLDRPESRDIVSCLKYANTYARKGDQSTCPCLWVGTTSGCLFNVVLNMPPSGEQRTQQPVMVSPSGTLLQMKGAIIDCSFLDSLGRIITPPVANWRDRKKLAQQNSTEGGSLRSMSPDIGRDQGQSSNSAERQFLIITSEKQIKVMSLPTQSSVSVHNVANEAGYIARSQIVTVQTCSCVLCFSSLGNVSVFSLPSLTPLLDFNYLPPNDVRILQTLCFTTDAQALYMPSASEIQRLACSVELYENVQEIVGHLFIPTEAPERPNQGFFKGLFGGGVSLLDREELFGEASGKASRAVAKHIPGSGGASLEGLRGAAQHGLSEMERLRLAALERGEKLGELEDKTQKMQESAHKFSDNAHSLMLKYKNKKWYQL